LQLAQARRFSHSLALVFLDLDHFKDVNDTLGHWMGDQLLAQVGRLFRQQLRDTDIAARLGGDEFTAILPQTDTAAAIAAAGRIVEALANEKFEAAAQPCSVTGSIGVAVYPAHGATGEELLSHADLAMYRAKETGRNRVSVYSSDADWQKEVETKLAWRRRIVDALEHDRFFLHAQPILDLRHGAIRQYELLLRMAGDDGEEVSAGLFIENAERFGLVQGIDRWVVHRAIELLASCEGQAKGLVLEANISGKALSDRTLLEAIRRDLVSAQVDPARLVLEVTETAAISNLFEAQEFVQELKEIGCRFALDDFGVGFSSFYQLKHLPVDFLKIDGTFIKELRSSEVDQHLVKAIVELAHALGKETIAEFVGDGAALTLLRTFGVDYAQGYHIGRPADLGQYLMPAGDLPERDALPRAA